MTTPADVLDSSVKERLLALSIARHEAAIAAVQEQLHPYQTTIAKFDEILQAEHDLIDMAQGLNTTREALWLLSLEKVDNDEAQARCEQSFRKSQAKVERLRQKLALQEQDKRDWQQQKLPRIESLHSIIAHHEQRTGQLQQMRREVIARSYLHRIDND